MPGERVRPIRWGDGTKWGDKNARWGSPSYVLEIGDPGHVNTGPEPGNETKKKKSKVMSASNETPRNRKVLLPLARDMLAGMVTLQDVIDLHHHRDTTLRPRILALDGDPDAAPGSNANKGSQLVYKDCGNALTVGNEAVDALSNGAVKTWLDGYRTVIRTLQGPAHNAGWIAAGFTFNKTQVPRKADEREVLLMSARAYLAAHPTYECSQPQLSGPPLAITAAQALALHGQLNALGVTVNNIKTDLQTCKIARDSDEDALFDEVSGATTEIGQVLEDDDPRWEQMGLNIPASPNPPEAVSTVSVTSAGPSRELAEWPHARRATYYRAFIKINGVDADFRFVDHTEDLDFIYKDLPTGTAVSIYIIAANDGGEAAASPTVTKVVGA